MFDGITNTPDICQRWRKGRASYRLAGEPINTAKFGVEPIDEQSARAFVVEHHYSASYPVARFRVGLFRQEAFRKPALCGVAIFSVPMNNGSIRHYAGHNDGVELGRFVLLDNVEANGETWMLGQARQMLKQTIASLQVFLSYSDPAARYAEDGTAICPGHIGTIYQASNARYVGRSKARTLILNRDGRVVSERALSKLRNDEQGANYAYSQLLAAGAPRRQPNEDSRNYVTRALQDGPFRRIRHPGNHAYLFGLGDRRERFAALATANAARPYPKSTDEVRL